MTLNIADLPTVWEALIDTRSKAYNIGLQLNIPVGTLDSIRKQYSYPPDQLREILKAWLEMAAQQKWQSIVDALRSRTIGEPKLASDIEADYCQDTPVQASGQAMPRDTQMQSVKQTVTQPQETDQLRQKLREQQRAIEAGERKQRELTKQLQLMDQTVTQQQIREQQHAIEAMQTQQELKQLQSVKRPSAQPQATPPQGQQREVKQQRDTQVNAHKRVVQKCDTIITFLATNVSPGGLADKLRGAGLINDEIRQLALVTGVPTTQNIRPMIDAVISRIELNEANYDKFISILKECGSLDDLIQFIEK